VVLAFMLNTWHYVHMDVLDESFFCELSQEADYSERVDIFDTYGYEIGYAIYTYDKNTGILDLDFYENTA